MKTVIAFLALQLGGCVASVGTQGPMSIPRTAPDTCSKFCTDMGLALSSVVIMSNQVGCVCAINKQAKTDGEAALAGMATIEQQKEAQRQQH